MEYLHYPLPSGLLPRHLFRQNTWKQSHANTDELGHIPQEYPVLDVGGCPEHNDVQIGEKCIRSKHPYRRKTVNQINATHGSRLKMSNTYKSVKQDASAGYRWVKSWVADTVYYQFDGSDVNQKQFLRSVQDTLSPKSTKVMTIQMIGTKLMAKTERRTRQQLSYEITGQGEVTRLNMMSELKLQILQQKPLQLEVDRDDNKETMLLNLDSETTVQELSKMIDELKNALKSKL